VSSVEPRRSAGTAPRFARYLAASRADRAPGEWKEWCHVVVVGTTWLLLANISRRRSASGTAGGASVLIWTREGGCTGACWEGASRRIGPDGLATEGIQLAPTSSGFHLSIHAPRAQLRAELELRFAAEPLVARGAPLGSGVFEWMALPVAAAHGWFRTGHGHVAVSGAPAYHDQNWGNWRWGEDLGWQWGYLAPIAGCTVVLSRMLDRRRLREADRRLLVWHGDTLVGDFQGPQVQIAARGRYRGPPAPLFPPSLRLLDRGGDADVPGQITVTARSGADALSLDLAITGVAVLGVPDDTGLDVTLIQEATCRASVRGELAGDPIAGETAGLYELVHGA